jgi:cyanamide hydratase
MTGPTDPVTAYGWTALPRKVETLLATRKDVKPPAPVHVKDIAIPDSPRAQAVHEYAKQELPLETFNHSMRVYYYGIAIAKHNFPHWLSPTFNETYFFTCLLHDIGTTDKNISATLMSFEFYGGMLVLDLLGEQGAPKAQAESVAEAIMRHQDLGDAGTLTMIGALIQLATILGKSS